MAPTSKSSKKLKRSPSDNEIIERKKEIMDDEHPAVTLFRDYLRIKSVQPNPDNQGCVDFLKVQAEKIGLPMRILELVPGKPIVIMTWEGSDPSLPSLLLNSHTDVVPIYPENWRYDAFEAFKDENGDIYARGTQDMKCVTIWHLEAIRILKLEMKKKYKRTIHLSFVPDEEIGGFDGMVRLIATKAFKDMNVGYALDEGIASGKDSDIIPVFYGERNSWWVVFKCEGNPGHGSQFIQNNAAAKAHYLINKLLGYREEQRKKLEENPTLKLGDVTTVNLTYMNGGSNVQMNIVPQEFEVGFDIRIAPSMKTTDFDKMLNGWAKEAAESQTGNGGGVSASYVCKFMPQGVTSVADNDPWYSAFKKGADLAGIKVEPRIFPAGTDSRYLREIGIPALGFSPMPNTPILLHDHNEMLNEDIFIKGIDPFVKIIDQMAQV